MLVSLDDFEQDDFLSLIVNVVQHPVRADTESILGSEL